MKTVVSGILLLLMAIPCRASVTDFVVGIALMANGGVFEYLRGNSASDKDDSASKATTSGVRAIQADEAYFYWGGVAALEFQNNGNSANYRSYSSNSFVAQTQAFLNAGDAVRYSNSASDSQNKEKIYKGVSLTSFALGGAFLIKGTVSYFFNRIQTASAKKYRWAKNFDLSPAPNMDGAQLAYNYRF